MKNKKLFKLQLHKFESLSCFSKVDHFVATRKGGFSKKPFDQLSLSIHIGDDEKDVTQNRFLVAHGLGIDPDDLIFPHQTHSKNVATYSNTKRITKKIKGFNEIENTDAIITNEKGKCLLVTVADCVPILFYDPKKSVIGVAHAGWRGTIKQIAKNTAQKMQEEFGCMSRDLTCSIGPAIGPCCYEVTNKQRGRKWQKKYSKSDKVLVSRDDKIFLDLWQANKIQLLRLGIKEKNIELMDVCTGCNTDKFFSYKKEAKTGRFGVGIMLKE